MTSRISVCKNRVNYRDPRSKKYSRSFSNYVNLPKPSPYFVSCLFVFLEPPVLCFCWGNFFLPQSVVGRGTHPSCLLNYRELWLGPGPSSYDCPLPPGALEIRALEVKEFRSLVTMVARGGTSTEWGVGLGEEESGGFTRECR